MKTFTPETYIKIRGKQISMPSNKVTPEQIRQRAGIKKGRIIIRETNNGMEALNDGMRYTIPPNSKFRDAPAVRKAASYSECDYSYGKHRRPEWCNEVIRDQIRDLEKKLTHSEIYVDNPDNPINMLIPNFKLPKATSDLNGGREYAPLLIKIPDQFPFMPPVGFYLPSEINAGRHSGFSNGYHGAEMDEFVRKIDFKWYCSSVVADTWQPAHFQYISDWRKGDNLWDVITLIKEVLSDFSDD